MIFVKGYGQMCNNILQYAHAYAFGREYGIKVVSMRFAYKYRYFALCGKGYHKPIVYLLAKLLIALKAVKPFYVAEPEDNTPALQKTLRERSFSIIDGWHFRFPELFMKYAGDIRKLFTFNPQITEKVSNEIKTFSGEADLCVAVHVRRGDYINWLGGIYYFEDDVYIRNIRDFLQAFPDKKIAVFIATNDRRLSVDAYRSALGTERIFCLKHNEAEDLCMLSLCDYIIGVRSTFSLVASFLKNRPLYWIPDKDTPLKLEKFSSFEQEFRTV